MRFRLMASRHSAFYSPYLTCVNLLRQAGHDVTYGVLGPRQRTHALLRDGEADIVQSAVSSNWQLREQGIEPLPVHFAQINQRDGFFLAGRAPEAEFPWKSLEGKTLLADYGKQPLAMLKYAVKHNGVDWKRIRVVNAGAPDRMEAAFRDGTGDYVHLQGPVTAGEIVASVGACMPPVAFSSLCCAAAYRKTAEHAAFLEVYRRAREWVQTAPAAEIAAGEASFFPSIPPGLLTDTIARYQLLGTWSGGIEISRDLYEQALNVFQSSGDISWRHRYEEVVG